MSRGKTLFVNVTSTL